MNKIIFLVLNYLIFSTNSFSQLSAGPVIGHSTATSTIVWYQCFQNQKDSIFLISPNDQAYIRPDSVQRWKVKHLITLKAYFNQLIPNREYDLFFPYITSKKIKLFRPNFKKEDFSFLVGSCVLTLPSPAKTVYPGPRIQIFKTMKKDINNDFMLWIGDYVYYLKFHLKSKNGMFNRMNNQRVMFPEINQFQQGIVNYAMWDDHDYGPNNSEGNFYLKEKSKWVFDMQWPNPVRERNKASDGIYFKIEHKDIVILMMDCRYYKESYDSIKQMWGKEQMEWLKLNLLESKATFKFVSNGSQILTKSRERSPETLYYFRKEYEELMSFIKTNKIEGVVFLSGDIHSSEISKVENTEMYPLYEYTCSALTSKMFGGFHNKEVIPGYREAKINNYGKISITSAKGGRLCNFQNFDLYGNLNWEYSINSKDLTFKK